MFSIEKIKNVHIYTNLNTGEFFNNVVVIEESEGLTIIDSFIKKETMAEFLELIKKYKKRILRVIFSHWHIDHTLGAWFLRDYNIYSNRECRDYLINFLENHLDDKINKGVIENGLSVPIPNIVFEKNLIIPMEDGKELLLESLPGHSYDSILIYYDDFLIVGDNLVGKEVDIIIPPAIPPDREKSKPEHLYNMLKYLEKKDSKYLIYGHGKRLEPNDIILDNKKRVNILHNREIL